MNPFELNLPGVPAVGLGCAALSYEGVSEDDAFGTVAAAWEAGIRTFDVAPYYGSGLAEHRLGRALAGVPRDAYTLSTKVGRLVDAPDSQGVGTGTHFDFTADGVRRSIEESLARLGKDRIDILLIHDAAGDMETALAEAWPVLADLRAQGIVRAIGAGMGQAPMLTRFAAETEMDVFLVAGPYGLLDRDALHELFPLCQEKGIEVMVAQMLQGGLIEGVPNPRFRYQPVPPEIEAQVARIAAICRRHGVPMAAAAIQFPLAHPVVSGVLTGPRNPDQFAQNLGWLQTPIPAALWDDLKQDGLLEPDVPVPADRQM
jgi:D-threo-aldose 1-dehydrogenase